MAIGTICRAVPFISLCFGCIAKPTSSSAMLVLPPTLHSTRQGRIIPRGAFRRNQLQLERSNFNRSILVGCGRSGGGLVKNFLIPGEPHTHIANGIVKTGRREVPSTSTNERYLPTQYHRSLAHSTQDGARRAKPR